jgi:DNA-binding CsgD family transcriptional regulator
MLRGRGQQCSVLDGLLAEVRAGRSQVLVIRGEPGIGKTALLGYATETAPDFRVARADGIESEVELPFAALHQLLGPMLGRLGALPGPQRDALGVAFGLWSGSAPDRFLVGLAVLGLLSEEAAERPLLCLVDDAQWLDQASAQALAFAARRLDAESVALLFGTRDRAGEGGLARLPGLAVSGLADADARAMLASVIPGRLDERVRDRIIAESGGNPLALLELPHGITAADLAGGFGVAGPLPVAGRIEQSFVRRIAPLPEVTRLLLLLAAAEPTGDPALLWRAGANLGISAEDAASPAEADGLLTVGGRVIFRHPLVRSAVYQAASAGDRRRAHGAIAEATDPGTDPDRRAWHRAQAAPQPDEDVAVELERSASRAQGRGGLAAAAAFLERAALLTPDPVRRAQRLLAAARAKRDAGALDAALALLVAADARPLCARGTAEVERMRGQIALDQRRASAAASRLLSAARRFEPFDAGLARETYLEALLAAMWDGGLDSPGGVRGVAEAARAAPSGPDPPRAVDVLLDAFALRFTQGYAAAPALTRALDLLLDLNVGTGEARRWLWLASGRVSQIIALELWDAESLYALAAGQVQVARDTGALVNLQFALNYLARTHILAGEPAAAARLIEEDRLIAEATGNPPFADTAMMLAAWRGQEAQASELIETTVEEATARGLGRLVDFAAYASSVLHNGLGQHDTARDAARRAFERDQLGYGPLIVPELAEAAARTGDVPLVQAALDWLSERARVTPTDWALGIQARIRALLSEGEAAESCYLESIEHLGRTRVRVELGRAHLLYGEWLRGQNRRAEARAQLRTAHRMLTAMGADGFAERAARELRATGERVRNRTTDAPAQLTARETQIARLAGDGLSNPDIAAQLFMSPRTVEYHLHKVFTKLDIGSRSQLDGVLASRRKRRTVTNPVASIPG